MYSISSSCCSIGADLTAAAAKPESERLQHVGEPLCHHRGRLRALQRRCYGHAVPNASSRAIDSGWLQLPDRVPKDEGQPRDADADGDEDNDDRRGLHFPPPPVHDTDQHPGQPGPHGDH